MTENRFLKREIRARMEQTGENYTTARRAILAKKLAERPAEESSE